jgi:hypothetical protein
MEIDKLYFAQRLLIFLRNIPRKMIYKKAILKL